MGDGPRSQPPLILLPGGLGAHEGPVGDGLPRAALRVIPGGPAGDLQAAIEETILAARRLRQEIEARIARELQERF